MNMGRLLLIAILLVTGIAAAQTTTLLPQGGLGLSCNAVTAATAINPGLAGGCTSLALVTSGGTLPGNYTWQTITTGSPGSVSVTLVGSLDNVTWTTLDTNTSTAGSSRTLANANSYRFLGCVPGTLSGGASPTLSCQISVTSTAGGGGGGGGAFSSITAGTNTAALVMGTGGSLVTSVNGQLSADSDWLGYTPAAFVPGVPTVTCTNAGGNLAVQGFYTRLTFVGLSAIIPSNEIALQMNATTGCGSGVVNQITITMPANCQGGGLPAGATGCTVWDGLTVNGEKQQAASANCVNITSATCVISTAAAGSNLSATVSTTTGVNPPNFQSTAVPDFISPAQFIQKSNGYYAAAGIDTSALNFISCCFTSIPNTPPAVAGSNGGTYTWFDRFFFNDTNSIPIQANNFVSIHHQMGQTTSTLASAGANGIDDRAFGVEMVNSGTANPFIEQLLSQYNENQVSNNNFTCAPISAGVPAGEDCASAGRFNTTDTRTANNGANANQYIGVSGVASYNGADAVAHAGGLTIGYVGGKFGSFQGTLNTNGQNNVWAGAEVGFNGAGGNTNSRGAGLWVFTPTTRMSTYNLGIQIADFGANTSDWNILSSSAAPNSGNGANFFQGNVWLPQIISNFGTIAVQGSFGLTGGLSTAQLATPGVGNFSHGGTGGASSNTYKTTCVDVNGAESAASSSWNDSGANANLTGTNFTTLTTLTQRSCSSYNIYRVTSGSQCNGIACTNGKIGNVAMATTTFLGQNNGVVFNDTGQVGNAATAPTVNTTGGLFTPVNGVTFLAGNQAYLDANFTTANNTSLQTINGSSHNLVFNLPGIAQVYNFHCSLSYSQATANVAVAFGIQAATVAPNNIFANGTEQITVGPPATIVAGTLATLATTTATNIVSGTPGALATNYVATLDGTIDNPGINVLNFMVSTAAGADAVTVLKGSYCRLY
jgi:hypothetical protein